MTVYWKEIRSFCERYGLTYEVVAREYLLHYSKHKKYYRLDTKRKRTFFSFYREVLGYNRNKDLRPIVSDVMTKISRNPARYRET